jgi:hypothetical protein
MSEKREHAHHAQVGDTHLETWKAEGRYFWSITNTKTHQRIDTGETDSFDKAKMAASAAAGVQGERITWRGIGPAL